MKKIILYLISISLSGSAMALSPAAEIGKAYYPACHVCHDEALEPPMGPPMWGVKRRYKNNTIDDEDFVESMVRFVKQPSLESALHDMAVAEMGLMQPVPLPDEMLEKIVVYILEETFPPPCTHWQIMVRRMEQTGNLEHAERDQRMIDRYCR